MRSLSTTATNAGGSTGCSRAHQKSLFSESLLYVTFLSYAGCQIQVNVEIPESYQERNKKRLKHKKAEPQQKQKDMANIFDISGSDPYYAEMLKLNEERRKQGREWRRKQREIAIEKALTQKEIERDYKIEKEEEEASSEGLDLEELKEEIEAIVQE